MSETLNRVFNTLYRVIVLGVIYFMCNILLFFPLINSRDIEVIKGLGLVSSFISLLIFPSTLALVSVTKDYIDDKMENVIKLFLRNYLTYFIPSILVGIVTLSVIYVCGFYTNMFLTMGTSIFVTALFQFLLIVVAVVLTQIPRVILRNEKHIYIIFIQSFVLAYKHIAISMLTMVSVLFGLLLFNFIPLSIFVSPVAIAYIAGDSKNIAI